MKIGTNMFKQNISSTNIEYSLITGSGDQSRTIMLIRAKPMHNTSGNRIFLNIELTSTIFAVGKAAALKLFDLYNMYF